METITSLQNPRVKALVRLHSANHRRRRGVILVEGQREVSRALQAGLIPQEVFLCPELDPAAEAIASTLNTDAVELFTLSNACFQKASLRENPDGILMVAARPQHSLEALKLPSKPLVVIVERIEKPGNLGTLIRTCEGAGVDALLVADSLCDLYGPQVIRNSQGAVFSLPIVECSNETAQLWLEEQHLHAFATTPDTETLLWDAPLSGGVALLFGNEADGLSQLWLDNPAVSKIRIPMSGDADSLNIAAAAAITIFEAKRQRR